jgi:hypothetical protein
MKKKVLLIAAVILVGLGLLSISKIVQDKYISKSSVSTVQRANDKTIKEDVKPKAKEETAKTNVEKPAVTEQKNVVDSKEKIKTTVTKAPSTENVAVTKKVTKEKVTKTPEPKKEPNFIIKDDISGKVILSINISTENETVGRITLRELDNNGISYKASGRGESTYVTMINNLKVRGEGALSGWCYYVNGSKPSVSCGAYKLKSNDVVEWKYLKDGVNN